MAGKRFTRVVIGVGDIKNRSTKIEDAIEPVQQLENSLLLAG
jgi:hypothetical protein